MTPPKDPSAQTIARHWITKFTDFPRGRAGEDRALGRRNEHVVLLTGATGVIGCHILFSLIQRPSVARVYCLIRVKQGAAAGTRLKDVLLQNHLLEDATATQLDKIRAMHYDVGSKEKLGLSNEDYDTLRSVTLLIHNAWAVNFNMDFKDFEQHIRGTSDLLKLAMNSKLTQKPEFVFISTFGAIAQVRPFPILEQLYGIEAASGAMHYGLSKWTTEQICFEATEKTGLPVRILRLSQMCGDTRHGMWNAKEAWPQIIACAVTIGGLPAVKHDDEKHSWLPTDVAGAVIADLALLDQVDSTIRASIQPFGVFHVANSRVVLWKAEVLPALRRNGLKFETLEWSEWVKLLEDSDNNVLRNPPRRLLNFYKTLAAPRQGMNAARSGLRVDMTNATRLSPRLAEGVSIDEALIGRFVNFWKTAKGWAGQISASL